MNKWLTGMLVLMALGFTSISWAIEPMLPQGFKPVKPLVVEKPQLQLKGKLKMVSHGQSGEFCLHKCEPFSSDFNLAKLKCGFYITVKNIGAGRSQPTEARIIYSNGQGNGARGPMTVLRARVPALAPNQVRRLEFRLPTEAAKQYANTQYGILYDVVSTDPAVANLSVFQKPL